MSICGGVVSGLLSTDAISCTVVAGGGNSGGGFAPLGNNHQTVVGPNPIAAKTAAGDDIIVGEGRVAIESMSLLPNNSGTTHYGETTHNAAGDMPVTATNPGHDESSEMQLLTSSNDEQAAPLTMTTDDYDDVIKSIGRLERGGMHVVLVDYRDDD